MTCDDISDIAGGGMDVFNYLNIILSAHIQTDVNFCTT